MTELLTSERDARQAARDALTVTACVVVKDRRDEMSACLDALAAQALDFPDGGYDVLVVDNGSTDGTFEMLQERRDTFPVPLRVLQVPGPLGRARNAAVNAVSADVFASTDSDCIAAPGWLATLVSAIRNAERRIRLTTAYFVPTRAEREALIEAARRGVDVSLLLPGISDSDFALHVGQVAFVVEAETTGRRAIEEALNMVSGCRHINLILNKRRGWLRSLSTPTSRSPFLAVLARRSYPAYSSSRSR